MMYSVHLLIAFVQYLPRPSLDLVLVLVLEWSLILGIGRCRWSIGFGLNIKLYACADSISRPRGHLGVGTVSLAQ